MQGGTKCHIVKIYTKPKTSSIYGVSFIIYLSFRTRSGIYKLLNFFNIFLKSNIIDYTLSFLTRQKGNEKPLATASRSVATDYFPFSRSFAKNDKTPYGQTMPFF